MPIIVKKSDLGVVIIHPHADKYGPEFKEVYQDGVLVRTIRPYSECKGLQKYINPDHPEFIGEVCEWFWQDESIDKSSIESRKQLYHDGNSVKADSDWSVRIMPDQLIKQKHIKALNAELDTHLDNDDALNALKKQREIEKAKVIKAGWHNEECFWAEKALQGLSRASKDKPIIREKLERIISEKQKA